MCSIGFVLSCELTGQVTSLVINHQCSSPDDRTNLVGAAGFVAREKRVNCGLWTWDGLDFKDLDIWDSGRFCDGKRGSGTSTGRTGGQTW